MDSKDTGVGHSFEYELRIKQVGGEQIAFMCAEQIAELLVLGKAWPCVPGVGGSQSEAMPMY